MKKLFIILVVFGASSVFAQLNSSKWIKVLESPDESLYIDSSNINLTDDQLSIVSLLVYNEPTLAQAINKKVKNEKSQILFNLTSRKYTVLGTLFYDSTLKIVGESSLPGLSIGKESFGTSVDSNKYMLALFNKALSIFNISPFEFKKKETKPSLIAERLPTIINNSPTKIEANTTESVDRKKIEELNKFIDKTESPETKKENKPNISPPVTANTKEKSNSSDYQVSTERNLRGTIYTDGNKYCFQVSSWRNKGKAEREASKLKSKGHNAFITEAYVSGKGGTWYRVRVGYFNSAEETENYLAKMR